MEIYKYLRKKVCNSKYLELYCTKYSIMQVFDKKKCLSLQIQSTESYLVATLVASLCADCDTLAGLN